MPEKKKEIRISAKQLVDSYRIDQRKAEELQRRQNNLGQLLKEMVIASEAVKQIGKASKDESILVSLGAGVYAEAKISNVKSMKNSLAANVLVDSEAGKVEARLQKDIESVKKQLAGLRSEIGKTLQNMQGVAAILQEGQKAEQKAGQNSSESDLSSVS